MTRTRTPFEIHAFRKLLHPDERYEVIEELKAEYAARAALHGPMRARLWVWRQLAGSGPALFRRGWHRGTTGFEAEANRMRGGVFGLEGWLLDVRPLSVNAPLEVVAGNQVWLAGRVDESAGLPDDHAANEALRTMVREGWCASVVLVACSSRAGWCASSPVAVGPGLEL